MWPKSIWNNYVRAKEQKRLLREKLIWLRIEEMRLSLEWNGMLVARDYQKTFSSTSELGLAQVYKEFLRLNEGNGTLGSLFAIKNNGRSILSGTYNLFISYSQLELLTGVSKYQYEEVVRKYEETREQIHQLDEQLQKKNLLSMFFK